MIKSNFIGMTLFILLTVLSPIRAVQAFQSASIATAKDVLASTIRKKMELDRLTVPGRFEFNRAHVSEENSSQVKMLSKEIVTNLSWLKPNLQWYLSQYRLKQLEADATSEIKNILEVYNSFLNQAGRTELVFDDENLMGSYSSSKPLFKAKDYLVPTSPFDFTTGFVAVCKHEYGSGILVYQDPLSGAIVWKTQFKSALAVVGVTSNGSLQIKDDFKGGLSSTYNPVTQKWEVNKGRYKSPTASVWNPKTQTVETQSGGYNVGIGGVYNPVLQKVEWKKSYQSGVAGYFDETTKKVVWQDNYKSGVACVTRSQDGTYTFSNSFFGGELDEDD